MKKFNALDISNCGVVEGHEGTICMSIACDQEFLYLVNTHDGEVINLNYEQAEILRDYLNRAL